MFVIDEKKENIWSGVVIFERKLAQETQLRNDIAPQLAFPNYGPFKSGFTPFYFMPLEA